MAKHREQMLPRRHTSNPRFAVKTMIFCGNPPRVRSYIRDRTFGNIILPFKWAMLNYE